MNKIFRLLLVFSIPAAVLLLSNCKKDQFGSNNLVFSTDTLTFDTVFTTLGSTTRYFKVFNTSSKAVTIESIRLSHLTGDQYRINVDGVTGDQFTNVEIPAKDSIYVFVEVTVNPNSAATPFVIIDDVEFITSASSSKVHLQAFGQNAHFHYGEDIKSGTVYWTNDLPHVIISRQNDSIPGVFVRCNASLNIGPGCKIFFAGNSAIIVEGSLYAQASSWQDSIVFQGARLETFYEDKPGQWSGIIFLRDTNQSNACASTGIFDHCVITESSYGINAGSGLTSNLNKFLGVAGRPEILVQNTIIKNSQFNAINGFNAKVTANNSIFYTAGEHLLKLGLGGEYNFTHCTLVNNGSRYISHEKEALLLSNFVSDGTNAFLNPLKTTFTNCVLYGSLENEISFNNFNPNPFDLTNFDNAFHYSDVKTRQDTFELFAAVKDNMLFNEDPKFKKADAGNFTPWDSIGYFSPLIDYAPTGSSEDIFGTMRPVSKTTNANKFDVGAVETR
ncbi:MAG: hypothetical protein V4615_03655 [Bacteroidota bacterium]